MSDMPHTADAQQRCEVMLQGAYDLHIHPAPSPFGRALDDIQLLQAAGRAGMAGILLKSHYESTAARAELANRYADSPATAYGALALNWPSGGLNPYAVHNALKRGAKIIFMPTRDAANSLLSGDMPGDFFRRPGLTILSEGGSLKPAVYEILDAVKQYGAVLATGHISPEESVLLCREGVRLGVRMILTHPEFTRTRISASVQKELADLGVYIEKCWYNIDEKECTPGEMASHIKTVGASRCYLTTDRGQRGRGLPAEALKHFLAALLQAGLSEQELFQMTHTVPKEIVTPK